jgi:hypothetical protein
MQVKFAYAASGITRGGEASIGVAARAVATSIAETVAIGTQQQSVLPTRRSAPFSCDRHHEKKTQAASRGSRPARPVRLSRSVPMRTAVLAMLPTRKVTSSAQGAQRRCAGSQACWPLHGFKDSSRAVLDVVKV